MSSPTPPLSVRLHQLRREHATPPSRSHRSITPPDPPSQTRNFEVLPKPKIVNCQSQDNFVAEAARLIVKAIEATVLESAPIPRDPLSRTNSLQNDLRWSGRYALVGLCGGTTPLEIYRLLGSYMTCQRGNGLDWSRVIFFLVDERYVPETHPDSNTRMIKESLFGLASESPINCTDLNLGDKPYSGEIAHLIYPNTQLPLQECIEDYDRQLAEVFQFSRPTCVVLGIGKDLHIASWFPPLGPDEMFAAYDPCQLVSHTRTKDASFAVTDRITVAMHLLASAKEKIVLINSRDKVLAVRDKLESKLSAQAIREQPLIQILRSSNVTIVTHPPELVRDEITDMLREWSNSHLTVIVLGASGDLAKKKTFPALFSLYCLGQLPSNFLIVGYARTHLTRDAFLDMLRPALLPIDSYFTMKGTESKSLASFEERIVYQTCSSYDSAEDAARLHQLLKEYEAKPQPSFDSTAEPEAAATSKHADASAGGDGTPKPSEASTAKRASKEESGNGFDSVNRIVYLALPPDQFVGAVKAFRTCCWSSRGWNRCIIEKPFGRDLNTSCQLSGALAKYLTESETFRIDHYLGKGMVLNLLVLRFANTFLTPLWNRHWIQTVRITFKETVGTAGRGGYFDRYGIIRDVIQNHLIQILSLVAMEAPASLNNYEDVRDEKVKVLKCIRPIKLENLVVGQYMKSEDGSVPGYQDDPSVPKGSLCPTFAVCVMFIDNERWAGVPFVMKAGKALEKAATEIRMQMRPPSSNLFASEKVSQNELVIRIQPKDAIYLKCMGKMPGLSRGGLVETELDFSVQERLNIDRFNDAYERLLLDVVRGDNQNFVRADELREAWRIFTPVLEKLEERKIKPEPYPAGSKGPKSAYELVRKAGYVASEGYSWSRPNI